MPVTLSADLEAIIRDHVASGDFADASAVVAEALRLLDEHNQLKLERLRAALQVGLDDIEQGRYREFTPEVATELWENGLRKVREGHRSNPDVLP